MRVSSSADSPKASGHDVFIGFGDGMVRTRSTEARASVAASSSPSHASHDGIFLLEHAGSARGPSPSPSPSIQAKLAHAKAVRAQRDRTLERQNSKLQDGAGQSMLTRYMAHRVAQHAAEHAASIGGPNTASADATRSQTPDSHAHRTVLSRLSSTPINVPPSPVSPGSLRYSPG